MKHELFKLTCIVIEGLALSVLIALIVLNKITQRKSDEEYEKYFKRLDDTEKRREL